MKPAQTLIISRRDTDVQRVVQGLEQRGREVVVLHTDDLGDGTTASVLPGGVVRVRQRREDGVHTVTLEHLESVWYRRLALQPHLPDDTPREVAMGVVAELRAFVLGLLAQLEGRGVRVLQPKERIEHADRKPRQLALAHAAGLDVPRTLTTTDPDAVRQFLDEVPGRLVTKVFTGFALRDGDSQQVVMTNEVDREALLAPCGLDGIELCPATFQELLPKARELRVTVVGEQILAASIDTRGVAEAEIDWRRAQREVYHRWQPATVPDAVSAALLRLLRRLGLDYAAVDLIETPDGRWVFLEANPAGEYLWLDGLLQGAVSRAIVDWLAPADDEAPAA